MIIWGAGYNAAGVIAEDLGVEKWWPEPEIVTKGKMTTGRKPVHRFGFRSFQIVHVPGHPGVSELCRALVKLRVISGNHPAFTCRDML